MRNYFVLPIVLQFIIAGPLTAQSWNYDINEAKSLAAQQQKAILLVFQGSDWCVPCIKLHKEVWDSPEFEAFSEENLIPVKVDFPRRKKNSLSEEQVEHNESLAEAYNPQGIFPLVVLIDAKGQILGETGYKSIGAPAYIAHLQTFLQ